MGIRIRLAAGILLAVTAGGAVGLAPAAGASPVGGATVAGVQANVQPGPREGPFSSGAACSVRARYWTETTGQYHFCRYKDGSDGLAAGWWVWPYL